MSNSENHQQVTKGKWGLNKPKTAANCSSDLAFGSDKDFVELVCENGQIVMQGQSSKEKKTPVSAVSTNTTCIIEDGVLPIPPKGGKFSPPVSVAQEFSSNTLAAVGLIQDDDGVPWFNYPFDYSLEREYCSEFFAEMTGTNRNSMPAQTSGVVSDKIATLDNSFISTVNNANLDQGNSYRETLLDSNLGTAVCGTSGVRSSHPIQSPQFQSSTQGARLKPLDFCGSDNFKAPPQLSTPMTGSAIMPHPIKAIQSSANASGTNQCGSVLNFSHFSRPAVLSKSNPHSVGAATGIPMPDPFKEKKGASDNKSIGSSIVDSNGLKPVGSSLKKMTGCNKIGGVHQDSELFVREGMDLGDKTTIRILPNTTKEDVGCQDGWVGRNGYSDQKLRQSSSFAASIAFGKSDSGKTFEPLVASSSVCSGSSAGRTVKNAKHGLKRKFTEIDESGYHSDDVEEESVGLRKPSKSKSTSAKRSRASEVHNLSERRRRDRINEKMRALQELIPNCNKADKASMLDEAIEYLKTLQLQVQMMSMGSGMYMPPMMLPAGIRHMHATHMAHFSPVGVGMGMGVGMGYGMGMLDMGCSSACPMIPMPPMRSPHLPCSSLPGPVALSGIPGSGVPMFGVPGPGLPVAMPGLPFTPFPGCSAKPVSVPEASSEAATLTASGLVQSSVSRSLPDIAKISSVNCENTQQIQKSQGAKGIHLQSNMAHQTGHTKGTEDPNNAETDGVPSSSAAVVDLYS